METSPGIDKSWAERQQQHASPAKVTFADENENASLLGHHTLSRFPQLSASTEDIKSKSVYTAPAPPKGMSKAPTEVDGWPSTSMRVPCTNCGHFIATTVKDETEYMGCKSCFTQRPVFRRSFVHYCPNCEESIGFHYTGEDCFCNHSRSTMTCDRVISAACWMDGYCQ